MNFMGVEFAPLNTPVERRLQTLAATMWFITMVCGGLFGVLLVTYWILYTRLCAPTIIYLAWIYFDRNTCNRGGRRCAWVRGWIWWQYFCAYFPFQLIKTADLSPKNNYLFCVYPHGLLCSGAFGHFGTDATEFRDLFPGLRSYLLTLSTHFKFPIFRELTLSLGACSASKESLYYLLDEKKSGVGKAVVLMVGGAAESLYCHPGSNTIILRKRKGFIKVALKTGTPLVPVFSFGETDLYDQVFNPPGSWLLSVQNTLRRVIGIAPCIPIGRGMFQYTFGIVPQRRPVITVVGSPIEVIKVDTPSEVEIDDLHSVFMREITQLFETYKHKYILDPKAKLVIE